MHYGKGYKVPLLPWVRGRVMNSLMFSNNTLNQESREYLVSLWPICRKLSEPVDRTLVSAHKIPFCPYLISFQ